MKKFKKVLRDSVGLFLLLLAALAVILVALFPAVGLWVLGGIAGIVILWITVSSIRNKGNNEKPQTKQKSNQQSTEPSLASYFLKFVLITLAGLVAGAIVLAIPLGVFMLLFPTYDMMAIAFSVLSLILILVFIHWITKRGGYIDVSKFHWW